MTVPAPVAIPGFSFVRALGAGGAADVLLYRQEQPRREVAVRILSAPLDDAGARDRFARQASAMTALSQHPSIVTIHQAAIAPDDRPYLVMEYCSLPTLAARAEKRPLPVPELIQTMVRLSGAVETAHRVGILHRHITPDRVLTTDYGWPALAYHGVTDLTLDDEAAAGSPSMPWAAPEAVAGRGWDERSDVYSLAATAYTALSGGSPFPAAPGSADVTKLMTRVLRDPVPRIGRDDVPASLERVLHAALSKSPAERPQTAADFARALQSIEQELNLPVTHLDIRTDDRAIREDETDAAADGDAESTFLSSSRPRSAPRADDVPAPSSLIARSPDEETVLSRRTPPSAQPLAAGSREEPPDGATVLSRRDSPTADEATALVRRAAPPVPDETMRSRRAGAAEAHRTDPAAHAEVHPDDEATRLVARDTIALAPDPAAGTGPGTNASGADVADEATRFVPGRRANGGLDTGTDDGGHAAATAAPPPPTRLAYSPADAGVASRVYGVRAAPTTAPPSRSQSAASAPSPSPAAVPPGAKAPRRRGLPVFVIVGIGALAVTAGAAAALIALVAG